MTSELECDARAQKLCWEARQYAFLCAEEWIETRHLLLAAVEVTPMEWHGFPQLTQARLLDAMERTLRSSELSDVRPTRRAPAAQEVLATAAEMASQAGRPVSCRDIWVALLEDARSTARFWLESVGIDANELQQRLREKPSNTA